MGNIKKKNKGEWSEFYAMMKIIDTNTIHFCDQHLNKTDDRMVVQEVINHADNISYKTFGDGRVSISFKNCEIPDTDEFDLLQYFDLPKMFDDISTQSGSSFALEIQNPIFEKALNCFFEKGKSNDKRDLSLSFSHNSIGYKDNGFSVKSLVGGSPTLLNASGHTNIVYEIVGFEGSVETLNQMRGLSEKLQYILEQNGHFQFSKFDSDEFAANVKFVDSQMEQYLALLTLEHYLSKGNPPIKKLIENVSKKHANLGEQFLKEKITDFLIGICFRFMPSEKWDPSVSSYKADGFIFVTKSGELLSMHRFINEKDLKSYLYENTMLETPGRKKHGYGYPYEENGKLMLKLNLQVRIK